MTAKGLIKTVLFSAAAVSLCTLFGGCQRQRPQQHELSEVVSVSASCSSADRTCGYSFSANKTADGWLFCADCFTNSLETETKLENTALSGDEVNALLEILEKNESIVYAENYKKPKKAPSGTRDGDSYGFALTFSDETQYVTYERQPELERLFYSLAEHYGNAF